MRIHSEVSLWEEAPPTIEGSALSIDRGFGRMKFGSGKFNGFWPFPVGAAQTPEGREGPQPDSNPHTETWPDASEIPKD